MGAASDCLSFSLQSLGVPRATTRVLSPTGFPTINISSCVGWNAWLTELSVNKYCLLQVGFYFLSLWSLVMISYSERGYITKNMSSRARNTSNKMIREVGNNAIIPDRTDGQK